MATILAANTAHNADHYGNLVTYMRRFSGVQSLARLHLIELRQQLGAGVRRDLVRGFRAASRAAGDDPSTRPPSPQPNFTPAAQHGFAARMLWSVTSTYADANHEPTVAVRDVRPSARPGETVRLEGTVSDPDGNTVAVGWWRWKDVDTHPGEVSIQGSTSLAARFRVPSDAEPGQTIHVVLEATDDGHPALTRYQRVVVSVTR